MRVITTKATDLRRVRLQLRLTQEQFAGRLGISRRSVIRGEVRGLEIPWYSAGETGRNELLARWEALKQEADRAVLERPRSVTSEDLERWARDRSRRLPAEVSRPSIARRDTSAGKKTRKVSRRRRGEKIKTGRAKRAARSSR